ncbi:MAG: hypothetical protein ACI9FJ_000549 [Alteromonadaceae bacterium]|jgi:hypothetical protein
MLIMLLNDRLSGKWANVNLTTKNRQGDWYLLSRVGYCFDGFFVGRYLVHSLS